LKYSPSFSTNS